MPDSHILPPANKDGHNFEFYNRQVKHSLNVLGNMHTSIQPANFLICHYLLKPKTINMENFKKLYSQKLNKVS